MQDVYRIGTLMELVRVLALSFADDGKHVKVCMSHMDELNTYREVFICYFNGKGVSVIMQLVLIRFAFKGPWERVH